MSPINPSLKLTVCALRVFLVEGGFTVAVSELAGGLCVQISPFQEIL